MLRVSKSVLIGSIAACVLAVGLIAALTATVIVDEGGGGSRILRADGSFPRPGPGMPLPGPGFGREPGLGFGPRGMRECVQREGPRGGTLETCRDRVPGVR